MEKQEVSLSPLKSSFIQVHKEKGFVSLLHVYVFYVIKTAYLLSETPFRETQLGFQVRVDSSFLLKFVAFTV